MLLIIIIVFFLTSSVNFIIDTYTCDVIFSGLSYMHVATYLLSTFGTSKSFFGVNPPRAILDSRPPDPTHIVFFGLEHEEQGCQRVSKKRPQSE